jgi:hypothetical protein
MRNTKRLVKLAAMLLGGVVVLAAGDRSWSADNFYVVGGGNPWKRNIYYNKGNVGIGTDKPEYPLDILTTYIQQNYYGLKVQNDADEAYAIAGITTAPGLNCGVYGLAKGSAHVYGVMGECDSATGRCSGVQGWVASPAADAFGVEGNVSGAGSGVKGSNDNAAGYGVVGENSAAGGKGVYGLSSATSGGGRGVTGETKSTDAGSNGVIGLSNGGSANGVYGYANGAGAGVLGHNEAGNGFGICGENTAAAGNAIGVLGTTNSTSASFGVRGESKAPTGNGRGVYGLAYSSNGFGVQGENAGGGTGVWGSGNSRGVGGITYAASNGIGVYGTCSGANYAVYGDNPSSNGYAVYANGNMKCTGTLTIGGSKAAVVPTSKGNRKLYCQESPEVWFEDVGEGQLNGGKAHIDLDPLFLETVTINNQHPMKVFIQLNDDCHGVYVQRQAAGFVVKELGGGNSSAHFTYRVMAKRKGYETARLEAAPETVKVATLKETKK